MDFFPSLLFPYRCSEFNLLTFLENLDKERLHRERLERENKALEGKLY